MTIRSNDETCVGCPVACVDGWIVGHDGTGYMEEACPHSCHKPLENSEEKTSHA